MQRGREACTVIDLGEVAWDDCEKPRKFAISAGVGLDALVCQKALTSKLKVFLNKLHLGKLTYLLITVQSLFSMQTTEAAVRLDETPERKLDRIIYIAAMNFKAEGGGVPMGAEGGCHGRKAFDLQCTRNSEVAHIFMPAVPRGGKAYGNPRI